MVPITKLFFWGSVRLQPSGQDIPKSFIAHGIIAQEPVGGVWRASLVRCLAR